MDPKAYRLPRSVLPRRYDIDLDARVDRPTFHGHVLIHVDVVEPTDHVELHAVGLDVSQARVRVGDRHLEANTTLDPDREILTLRLPHALARGDAHLEIHFTGRVSQSMEGLYLSQDGPERCLATQCEETDARAIFPCFDEPEFKARFAWRVTTNRNDTVLANGPLAEAKEHVDGQSRIWTFHATKPMSSYLVALAIGNLASTPELVVRGIPLRVWALRGKEHLGDYAQTFTERALPWYENYFQAPYHFDKYDQVAVPSFSAGAMENSGLVIFRQAYLLVDPRSTSWRQEKQVALVIAHEAAHMWFGNLVTMRWWDDIWLNESFAEWIAHKCVDAIRPDYRIWDDLQASRTHAMKSDALESTHPIYSKVETPAQATEMFDSITYEKGSAVMRMLENFLGEDAFREGLRTYMREFAERNAQGSDLWRHLEQASRRPVTRIMESWILQGGHPVVDVRVDEAQGEATLHLRQARFYSQPGKRESAQLWAVPLVVRYEDDGGLHTVRHLLEGREGQVRLPVQGGLRWLHPNADAIGFYRLAPDAALLEKLLAHFQRLTSAEQAGLLDDLWGLVRADRLGMARFLDVLDAAMTHAEEYPVLDAVVRHLGEVEGLVEDLQDADLLTRYRAWVGSRFRPRLQRLGLTAAPGEDRNTTQSRVSVLHATAALAGDAEAIRAARAMAEQEATAPASVPVDLAGPAVHIAARYGDAATLERFVQTYEARRLARASPSETQRYLYAFSEFRDPLLVARVVGLLTEKRVPQEAVGPLLRLLFAKRHARLHAWGWMKEHWSEVREKLGDMWTGFLVEASGNLPATARADFVAFYEANLGHVARQSYARALEALDLQAEFEARTKPQLAAWLRART